MHDTLTTQPNQAVADLGKSPFDSIRRFREDGSEFWSARELMGLLGYAKWERFHGAIERAKASLAAQGDWLPGSGNPIQPHFADHEFFVNSGKGRSQATKDLHLSRFACYLVAMNGDSFKPEVAAAQRYFAIRTRQAELAEKVVAELAVKEARELADVAQKRLDALEAMVESQQEQSDRMSQAFQQLTDRINRGSMPPLGNYVAPAVLWILERFARERPTGGWEITVEEIVKVSGMNFSEMLAREIIEALQDLGYRPGKFRQSIGLTWYRTWGQFPHQLPRSTGQLSLSVMPVRR